MPKTSPSVEQSNALVQVGSLSAASIPRLLNASLYVFTKLSRCILAHDGTTRGLSSCMDGRCRIDKSLEDAVVKTVEVVAS